MSTVNSDTSFVTYCIILYSMKCVILDAACRYYKTLLYMLS